MKDIQKVLSFLEECNQNQLFSRQAFDLFPEYALSRLTTFRTGGSAAVLFPKEGAVLEAVLPFLKKEKIAYFVLGSGSNTLAKDEGYDGLVICLSGLSDVKVEGCEITAGAGVSITLLSSVAERNSLAGMEFFYGIPGSVGGAVYMNAGAYGGECKDVLKEVTFVTSDGEIKKLPASQLDLGYRKSMFRSTSDVILSATFLLKEGQRDTIRSQMEDLMARRKEKQPLEFPSAGSTFKRPEGRFAAQMIDQAGLKGFRSGGAMVSEKHAGFVINFENATSRDVFDVIEHVQKVILEKEGVLLEREVCILE